MVRAMTDKKTDKKYGEEFFEHDKQNPIEEILAPVAGFAVTLKSAFEPYVTEQYPFKKTPTEPRYHGKHQLNRHEDGLEKCVGCELCAMACPADAIYVEGGENTPEQQYSPGERYGKIWQVNYLRCIFCGMCVQACPTRALTMNNDYEIADDARRKLIYDKEDLLVPLSKTMLRPPHPMVENSTERTYYKGQIKGVSANQIDWVKTHRPDDDSLKNFDTNSGTNQTPDSNAEENS